MATMSLSKAENWVTDRSIKVNERSQQWWLKGK
jgi:hypothetical protein